MTLKTKAYCSKVLKQSKSPAFENLQEGDIITFSIPIAPTGRNKCVPYAAYITCKNLRTDKESLLSFNQIERVMECGEFIECPQEVIMDHKRFGEITEINNDEDLDIAYCALAAVNSILNNHFLFSNVIITSKMRDYTVEVTLDIPKEFYYEHLLNNCNEECNYGHLRKLCDFAKMYDNFNKTRCLEETNNKRDRLQLLIHDYLKNKKEIDK